MSEHDEREKLLAKFALEHGFDLVLLVPPEEGHFTPWNPAPMVIIAGKFHLHKVVLTPGVRALCDKNGFGERDENWLAPFLRNHAQGDWGALPAEDAAKQDGWLAEGSAPSYLSVWEHKGQTVWIKTEGEGTTVSLPEEI
jgi:hypothetical protein